MASPFQIGLFKGPRYSAFPWSHDNKISMSAGKITPIAWDFLNTGDRIEADVADVVRLAPMVVPTLDTYRVDIHAFALRLRSLGNSSRDPWSYEDFFNLNKNADGSKMLPSIPLCFLFSLNGFKTGTLLESLGIPTFKSDREAYLDYLRNVHSYIFDPVVTLSALDDQSEGIDQMGWYPASAPQQSTDGTNVNTKYNDLDVAYITGLYRFNNKYYGHLFRVGGVPVAGNTVHLTFRGTLASYIAQTYPNVAPWDLSNVGYDDFGFLCLNSTYDFTNGVPKWIEEFNGTNLLDKVYEVYKVDSISVIKDYIDWLLEGFLSLTENAAPQQSSVFEGFYGYPTNSVFSGFHDLIVATYTDLPSVTVFSGGKDVAIPSYPFDAYYKIIADWYINTAIDDPDTFYADHSFQAIFTKLGNGAISIPQARNLALGLVSLFNRFWSNDYFTSAFPSPQAGQAVGIPVNGTIVDLRNANAMQKLKERLLYAGSRFRDVLFAITGKRTSAAILEMSEVLGSWSNVINVDAVLQQSQSTNYSPQAGYAGTGLGYRAGGKDFSYTAEEPTVIMVFASIVPQASYFQGISRKFLRHNVYDYAVPQLANVGEQVIKEREIFVSLADTGSGTFGYTRRNGDWMWTPNEVHGDFQGTLDFWHNARIFGSKPSLSRSFLQVQPAADNLNRVFAVDSDSYDHFYCNFSFTGHIIRSLPKHVHYDL